MADSWFTLEDGVPNGPFTEAELQARYMWDELDDDVELWKMAKDGSGQTTAPITAGAAPFLVKRPANWRLSDDARAMADLNRPPLGSRALVLFVTSGPMGVAAAAAFWKWFPQPERARTLFVGELAAFVGMWFVYFMSRHGDNGGFFHVATLRRLLRRLHSLLRVPGRRLVHLRGHVGRCGPVSGAAVAFFG